MAVLLILTEMMILSDHTKWKICRDRCKVVTIYPHLMLLSLLRYVGSGLPTAAVSMLYSFSYQGNIYRKIAITNTYDHRSVKTGHPVRSAIHKH